MKIKHLYFLLLLILVAPLHGQDFSSFKKHFDLVEKPYSYSIYQLIDTPAAVDTNDFKRYVLNRFKKSVQNYNLNLNKYDEQNIFHILCNANEQSSYSQSVSELTPWTYSYRYFNKIVLNSTLYGLVFIRNEQAYERGKISYDLFVYDTKDSIIQAISLGSLEANAMEGITYSSTEISDNKLKMYFHFPQFYMDYGIENISEGVINSDSILFSPRESTGINNCGTFIDTATKETILLTFTPKQEIFYKNSKNQIYRVKILKALENEFLIEYENQTYVLKYKKKESIWLLVNSKSKLTQQFEDCVPLQHNQYAKHYPDWFPYFDPTKIK